MHILKKIISLSVFLSLSVTLAGCADRAAAGAPAVLEGGVSADETGEGSDVITIGFSQLGAESDWRVANTESIREALSREKGFELLSLQPFLVNLIIMALLS